MHKRPLIILLIVLLVLIVGMLVWFWIMQFSLSSAKIAVSPMTISTAGTFVVQASGIARGVPTITSLSPIQLTDGRGTNWYKNIETVAIEIGVNRDILYGNTEKPIDQLTDESRKVSTFLQTGGGFLEKSTFDQLSSLAAGKKNFFVAYGCPVYLGSNKPSPKRSWSLSETLIALPGTPSGRYSLTVTDAHYCLGGNKTQNFVIQVELK